MHFKDDFFLLEPNEEYSSWNKLRIHLFLWPLHSKNNCRNGYMSLTLKGYLPKCPP